MNYSAKSFKRLSRGIKLQVKSTANHYRWLISRTVIPLYRKLLYHVRVFKAASEFHSPQGKRFLELHYLLKDFLVSRIKSDTEHGNFIASQLLNVLKHCDDITYEEQGTAEAYALLHFLDRYHRFQVIFDIMGAKNLMPIKSRKIDILDVGTGPGPSMYAISDYYTVMHKERILQHPAIKKDIFSIDYVERSQEFRNWLHHFTEYANYYRPSEMPWMVPYHHGTFHDFEGLEFNRQSIYYDQDDDGDIVIRRRVEKYRFDIIVFSNFLTTKDQVVNYSDELKNCIRFLRNNGILIVVGAKSQSPKYRDVYEEISKAILSENYSNWKFVARCEKIDFENSHMNYSWGDCYGKKVKELLKAVYQILQTHNKEAIPPQMTEILDETLLPGYARSIEWEVHVFRKKAKMRPYRK